MIRQWQKGCDRSFSKMIGFGLDGRGNIPILGHGFLFTMLLW